MKLMMISSKLIFFLYFINISSSKPFIYNDTEEDISYWMRHGRNTIYSRIEAAKKRYGSHSEFIHKPAKNVIFFIGDGMGLTTITSGRIYKGQKNGLGYDSEHGSLSFEELNNVGLAKVFATDTIVSDSSATATSYLTGVKARKATTGVSGKVSHGDCEASKDPKVKTKSIFHWAKERNMWTGVVTTTRITHGTEGPLYSNSANRGWEAFAPDGCQDIASQLIHGNVGKDIRVILGGGSRSFLPEHIDQVRNKYIRTTGKRIDGRDLIQEWIEDKKKVEGVFVSNKSQLNDVNTDKTDYLFGLFDPSHLPYSLDQQRHKKFHHKKHHHKPSLADEPLSNESDEDVLEAEVKEYPSLLMMTSKALNLLKRSPRGYILFVESGRIDTAHHKNQAHKSLEEVVQLDEAVKLALDETNEDDTLIIVSADHSHTLTINGYAKRGTNILGLAGVDDDGQNYTTLMYGNGPGGLGHEDIDNRLENLLDPDRIYKSAVNVESAKHGGEDVPVYSRGPGSHLLTGVFDQTHIAHSISYAACIGPHKDLCPLFKPYYSSSQRSQNSFSVMTFVAILIIARLFTYQQSS